MSFCNVPFIVLQEKVERKKIILDAESGEETDTILIINLVRPFTPNQLKEHQIFILKI